MNDDTDVPPRSSRQNPAYRPTSDTPALHSQRIQSDARQIHTRSVAPYCCAIRALCRPIATQYGLFVTLLLRNTGSLSPYCYAIRAPATAMCSLRCAHTPTLSPYLARCAQYGLFVIPGLRSAYPGLYSGALSGRSIPPSQICHICRRQMFIPHRHLWRGGGRQAGGEVKSQRERSKSIKTKKGQN